MALPSNLIEYMAWFVLQVFVYYRGVLAKNQKEFDSCTSGKAFMFTLGRGEVIKGWEEGIRGQYQFHIPIL